MSDDEKPAVSEDVAVTCETCRFFVFRGSHMPQPKGRCRRYPTYVERRPFDNCGEHKFILPSKELLETELEVFGVGPRTRGICRNAGLRTVGDVFLIGKVGITRHGVPDLTAIRELDFYLTRAGVEW